MNLGTTYLGLELKNPIVCGSCPLGTNIDTIRQLEMAGAAAIVLPSLFEEEIVGEAQAQMAMESVGAGFGEASSYLPDPEGYHVGPDRYLDHVKAAKDAASIPIIGSLNGTTPGGWTRYAEKIEKAGADAIELNAYYLATDPEATGASIEERVIAVVKAVKEAVSIPIAVKLSPFYSSLSNFARELEKAGADGLVLFNRFYQPDIDIEELDVIPNLRLSTADELRLAPALAVDPFEPGEDVPRRHRRRPQRGRRHQGRDDRRPLGADGLGPPDPRAGAHPAHPRGDRVLAQRARLRVARADAGLDEHVQGPGPRQADPRQLHEDAGQLAAMTFER